MEILTIIVRCGILVVFTYLFSRLIFKGFSMKRILLFLLLAYIPFNIIFTLSSFDWNDLLYAGFNDSFNPFFLLSLIVFVYYFIHKRNESIFEILKYLFRSGYFIGVRLFVLLFSFSFILSNQDTAINGYGEIIKISVLENFYQTYLTFALEFFYPLHIVEILFSGEKPLNPIGLLFSVAIFSSAIGFIVNYILKLTKKDKQDKKRSAFLNIIDVLFLTAALIIIVTPFIRELDFF